MKRKRNRRVDDLLNLLLKIEENDYWRHLLASKYERQEDVTSDGDTRHIRGMKIVDTDVEEVNEKLWRVKSQSQSPDLYLILDITKLVF